MRDSGSGLFRRYEKGLLFSALIGTIVFIYFTGFSGAFVWDDRTYFVENDILPSLSPLDLSAFFSPSNYWGELLPFRDWLYALQYMLFGQGPLGYHLVSLILYGFTVWALLLLLSEWYVLASERVGAAPDRFRWPLAFVVLFFAVHPSHVETVTYISGQKDLLAGLFGFLTLLFWGRYFRNRTVRDLVVFVLCYYLTFLSKLSAVFLPFFIFVLSLTLYRNYARDILKQIGLFGLITLLPIAWVLYAMRTAETFWGTTSLISGVPFGERMVRALQILGTHTKLALFPYPLNFGYPYDFTGTFDVSFFIGLAILIFIGLTVFFRQWLLCLGGSLFFLGLFPVLQLFNDLNNATVYDRYLFVSVVGLGIVIGEGSRLLVDRFNCLRKSVICLGALALCLLAVDSYYYVPTFASDVASTEHAYQNFPQNSSSAFNYATSLIEAGEYAQTLNLINNEPGLARPSWVTGYLRGWIAFEQGQFPMAETLLRVAAIQARLGGYYPYPNVLLAKAIVAQGRPRQANYFLNDVFNAQIYNPLEFYRAKKLREQIGAQR